MAEDFGVMGGFQLAVQQLTERAEAAERLASERGEALRELLAEMKAAGFPHEECESCAKLRAATHKADAVLRSEGEKEKPVRVVGHIPPDDEVPADIAYEVIYVKRRRHGRHVHVGDIVIPGQGFETGGIFRQIRKEKS